MTEDLDLSGKAVARYTQGLGIDEPLAMSQSGVADYYEADGLGSVTSLTGSNGSVVNAYEYDSFGQLTGSNETVSNTFRYTGREDDGETKLYYYRARYYDPTVGRFLSEDPIRFKAGPNFYEYADNNPVVLVDPLGLEGHTWGPFSWYTNQQGMSQTEIYAEQAHEAAHRSDFWNLNFLRLPCASLEQRGFAAEIPVYERRIKELKGKKCLSDAEKKELAVLQDKLDQARLISSDIRAAKQYCTGQ